MSSAGVAEGELKGLAIANLRRILPEVQRHGDGPWYLLTAGGDYVRSLLPFNEIWDQLADTVKGQIVATVPTRDVLLFTGAESAEGVQAIRQRVGRHLLFRVARHLRHPHYPQQRCLDRLQSQLSARATFRTAVGPRRPFLAPRRGS